MKPVRRIILLGAIMLGVAGTAQAHDARHLSAQLERRAIAISLRYWRTHEPSMLIDGLPACGQPRIAWRPLRDGIGGEALLGSCRIVLSSTAFIPKWNRPFFCETVLHEIGHLVLGELFFAATNPDDPAHSPDPFSPMFAVIWRPVQACQGFGFHRHLTTKPEGMAAGAG